MVYRANLGHTFIASVLMNTPLVEAEDSFKKYIKV